MITIEYCPKISETINATLDFISKRPLVKVFLTLTKFCCFLMCIACLLKVIFNALSIYDILVFLFVLTWLFGHRYINYFFLRKILTKNKIDKFHYILYINQDKLWGINKYNNITIQQPWKQIKYIYKNNDGYIIPEIGAINAGRFTWLPKRGFTNVEAEEKFLNILHQRHIAIKV
jgi:hypothetical protein